VKTKSGRVNLIHETTAAPPRVTAEWPLLLMAQIDRARTELAMASRTSSRERRPSSFIRSPGAGAGGGGLVRLESELGSLV